MTSNRITLDEYRSLTGQVPGAARQPGAGRGWSSAVATRGCLRCGAHEERVPFPPGDRCPGAGCGGALRRFGSRMEARVHARLRASLEPSQRLYCQVRLPLFSLVPEDSGIPMYITVDFAICTPGDLRVKLIDAKGKRVSRDWRRGAAAAEVWYGSIEEVSS